MPRPMRRARWAASLQLGHGRHVRVGVDHVIQEAGREDHAAGAVLPNPPCRPGRRCSARLTEPGSSSRRVRATARRTDWWLPVGTGAGRGWSGWRHPGRARPARRCGGPGVTILSNRSRARTVLIDLDGDAGLASACSRVPLNLR